MIEATDRAPWIAWLGDAASYDSNLVGSKAAHLSLLAESCRVPPGFCLTADAYRAADPSGHMSPQLQSTVADAYAQLAQQSGVAQPSVAVRSSAVDEDGPAASFAGQHETLLNIVGVDSLFKAIEQSWSSAKTEQALAYRRQHGLSIDDPGIAVLVQLLVKSDVSGVLFSANPVTGCRNEHVVSASWGLGESIVGGTVTPDTWIVKAQSLEIIQEQISEKRQMTIAVDDGTREVDVPRFIRTQPSLSADQIREIARLGRDLEEKNGWPVDIEFTYSGSELYLLQCRPITTLNSKAWSSSDTRSSKRQTSAV